jgi:hypothetical protein
MDKAKKKTDEQLRKQNRKTVQDIFKKYEDVFVTLSK